MNFTAGTRDRWRGRDRHRTTASWLRFTLNFHEIWLKTLKLSACPRPWVPGTHFLWATVLNYYSCCFLLPSYHYHETYHSFCDCCISRNPPDLWFSPCQDLVQAPVLWALASFWLCVSCKYLHTEGRDYFCSSSEMLSERCWADLWSLHWLGIKTVLRSRP